MKNFKKIIAFAICMIVALSSFGMAASAYGYAALYSEDGRIVQVEYSQIPEYESVGWYRNYADVTTMLYAVGNRTVIVFNSEVDTYLANGWYRAPIIYVYNDKGEWQYADINDVANLKSQGWYDRIEDAQTTMYAADGRTIVVFNAEVEAYQNVGWSVEKPFGGDVDFVNHEELELGNVYTDNNYFADRQAYDIQYNGEAKFDTLPTNGTENYSDVVVTVIQ